jgi:hypothetical protein
VKETDRLKGLLNQKDGAGVVQNPHVILEGHRLNPAWCTQNGFLFKDLKILLLSIGD